MLARVISRRATFRSEESPFSRALADATRDGRPLRDLTASNPTTVGLVPDEGALGPLGADAGRVYVPAPLGHASARAVVGSLLGRDPAHVVITASTSEAYAHLLTIFCDPGDVVLAPRPSYPLIEVLAQLASVRVVHYDLVYDGTWRADVASLREAAAHRPRLVLAVSPNNPTGSYLDAEDLEALRALDVPIVIDEVFAAYTLEGRARVRELDVADGLVVTLGGLSKHAALPQLKLGWMAFAGEPARITKTLDALEHVADAFLSVATPVQLALPALLETGEALRARVVARLRENLAALDAAIEGTALSRLRVEGGAHVVLRVPTTQDDGAWACAFLAEGVITQPGYLYDFAAPGFVVLSLLTPEDVFADGVARIVRVVARAVG